MIQGAMGVPCSRPVKMLHLLMLIGRLHTWRSATLQQQIKICTYINSCNRTLHTVGVCSTGSREIY